MATLWTRDVGWRRLLRKTKDLRRRKMVRREEVKEGGSAVRERVMSETVEREVVRREMR